MVKLLKKLVSDILFKLGYEIRKRNNTEFKKKENKKYKITMVYDYYPANQNRPIGDVNAFLNDIKERGYNCKFAFDIGANKTDWSRMLKKTFPNTNMCLIDPLEEMKVHMEKFCYEFPGSTFIVSGVGSKSEKQILTINGENLEGSTMMIEKIPSYFRENKQREVNVITIDELIKKKELEIPDLVKLDIQGFELEALKGGEILFGTTEIFIIEISLFKFNNHTPDITEIINFMNDKGYVIYDIPSYIRRPFDGALAQIDICFTRKDSELRITNRW